MGQKKAWNQAPLDEVVKQLRGDRIRKWA